MGTIRQATRFPTLNRGFLGENNREGQTDEIFQAGVLRYCRNYHLVGRGRLQKRQGTKKYASTQVAGGYPVQQLMMYEWGSTRHLLALCNGTLARLNSDTWTAITGSLTFTAGQDNRISTTHFRDGTGNLIVGNAPGTGKLWKWTGSGNAEVLTATGIGPQYAADIVEYEGSLWALNTANGDTILERSSDQDSTSWPADYYMHLSRESPGVGMSRHGKQGLVVFFQRSTYVVYFNPMSNPPWVGRPIDNRIGCISRDSIVYDRGITYWAGPDGFYRLRSASGPVEFIGHAVGDAWANLGAARRSKITGFARGGTFSEIVWLASDGSSTEHDITFVWNPETNSWALFESLSGYLHYNCGCDWQDSDSHHITLLGDYSGYVWAAWGDDEYDTGYLDGGETGAAVQSRLQTGFLDFGYPGIKRLKEGWIDAQAVSNRNFSIQVVGLGEEEITLGTGSVGVSGGKLSQTFVFDISRLAVSGAPSPGQFQLSARSRAFQFTLTESSADKPHTLNTMWFWWLPRAARFNF